MENTSTSHEIRDTQSFIDSVTSGCKSALNNEGIFLAIVTPTDQLTSFHSFTEDNFDDNPEEIASYFMVRLAAFFAENGFIFNRYGKPIPARLNDF